MLRRVFGVKCNSNPAIAALITREKPFLNGERPFSMRVGDARIFASFGIAMVILANHTLRNTLIGCNSLVPVIWGVTVKDNLGWFLVLKLWMHVCAVFCSEELFPLRMLFLLLELTHHNFNNFINSAHSRSLALPFQPQSA